MNQKMATKNNMSMNKKKKNNPIKKSKTSKSLNDYDQGDYQALFEKCKHVMKGWTKEKLKSFLEENTEMSKKFELSHKSIMDFEKTSNAKMNDEIKLLNEILEQNENDMTMKEKRNHRQLKMEAMKTKENAKKKVEKFKNNLKKKIRKTKELKRMGETVKKAFNVVEIMLGMNVEE